MKTLLASLLLCGVPALAAIDGTVTNRSTGRPQEGASVSLLGITSSGMQTVGQVKTGAEGRFHIDATPAPGPLLVQAVWAGVTYNLMLPKGAPTDAIALDIFNASPKQPAGAKVTQHMILFEPGDGKMSISETYIYSNTSTTTWNNPTGGTHRFFLPEAAGGKVDVTCTAPQGMPVARSAQPAGRDKTAWVLDFAIKPGDTRIDLNYQIPFTGGEYSGRILTHDEATRLVAPASVTVAGEHLTAMGSEPRSKANIWDLKGDTYKVTITGTGSLRAAQGDAAPPAAEGDDQPDTGQRFEQILPRVNRNTLLILGLALAILAVGFARLYLQSPPAKETNERGRR